MTGYKRPENEQHLKTIHNDLLKLAKKEADSVIVRTRYTFLQGVDTVVSTVSKFMTANENLLKMHHKQMLVEKVPDNAPVRLFGTFFYEATGCIWSVVKLTFPPERTRWERISPNIPPSKLLRLIRPFPWR